MTLKEAAVNARKLMMPQCRMCPQCDGVACRGEVPGMGGKGTGSSFISNYNALKKITLNLKTIHDVKEPVLETQLFGQTLSMPVMPAPITGVNLNMGNQITEEDYIRAVIRGSKTAGIIPMVGDSAYKSFIEDNLKVLKEESVSGIPFIKPWNNEELLSRIDLAMTSAPLAVGVDIDAAGLDTLKMHGQRVDPKSIRELKEIKAHLSVPFILKGIMTVEEANLAVLAGADAIVVSNHGGRILDHTPATAAVLSAIAEAVDGRLKVLVDGGVRSGVDVFKLLALGADAVLIGRPFAQYAIGGGEEAVTLYAQKIYNELKGAMLLTGCRDLEAIRDSGKSLINLPSNLL
ncbi:alpha-hydroxy-acid oxidizing protein [Proteiniclasticum sp. SCR006]|uniref:L-lactate oxidase n=1 Tax=Proteiniclasticum aestuarii TaxID=2817862 RepID=A0A939H5D0_9CLOT|nr:alpha-hydroxy-acid oxidizing protein [Proteiniclasticum aestuarii]MBO1263436.1 alpha-hydroxy-acid oxidizing protein [Proteiniclasticum aestuarii]